MVKIDDDTQKALLLFNRRTEAAEAAKAAERNLAKAVKAKDEAAAALKRAQDSGGGAESVAEAEAEWRTAVDAWQRARDGEEVWWTCEWLGASRTNNEAEYAALNAGLRAACALRHAGVLGALTGVMGSLAALEVVRAIAPFGEDTAGKLLLVDTLAFRFRALALPKDPGCPACG